MLNLHQWVSINRSKSLVFCKGIEFTNFSSQYNVPMLLWWVQNMDPGYLHSEQYTGDIQAQINYFWISRHMMKLHLRISIYFNSGKINILLSSKAKKIVLTKKFIKYKKKTITSNSNLLFRTIWHNHWRIFALIKVNNE